VRKKTVLVCAVSIGGAAAAAAWAPMPGEEAAAPIVASTQPGATLKAPTANLIAELPARDALAKRRGELFTVQSWALPPAKAARTVKAAPAAPRQPTPPPMPYRVAGRVVHDGIAHVVLAKGDRVLTVRQGDTLDDGYRVQSISAQGVSLVYLPLGVAQTLAAAVALENVAPAVAAAAERPAARLRLEGPARIRAGDAFSVALKVTSDQAVRSAPVRLSFDAELLEPVEVRRGGFFADGLFSFRINPAGSIFIGAAGGGAIPADAEFFVVTFKPVRPGAAELKLSSVLLQGAAGRAIAYDQPAAFRTSIVQ